MAKWIPEETGRFDCASEDCQWDGLFNSEDELTNNGGSLSFILDSSRAADATVPSVESWKIDCSFAAIRKRAHADTLRLEILKRPGDVQEAFASRADDSNRSPAQFSQIGYIVR